MIVNARMHWNNSFYFLRGKGQGSKIICPSCHLCLTVRRLRKRVCSSWGSQEEEHLWSGSRKLSWPPYFIFTSLYLPASLSGRREEALPSFMWLEVSEQNSQNPISSFATREQVRAMFLGLLSRNPREAFPLTNNHSQNSRIATRCKTPTPMVVTVTREVGASQNMAISSKTRGQAFWGRGWGRAG